MALEWVQEEAAVWDADKARIIGREREGVFDARYATATEGQLVPGEWWRVVDGGRTVAYGWLDVCWGDAEILMAVEPEARGRGVGSFVLTGLAREALRRGFRYMYNVVRPTHPDAEEVTAWLVKHGFEARSDGSLFRPVSQEGKD